MNLKKIAETMRTVADDCADDASKLDATPFTNRGVGETFGNVLAMIRACATGVAIVAEELDGILPSKIDEGSPQAEPYDVPADPEPRFEHDLWACGIVDEIEVTSPESDLFIYGPVPSEQAARAKARTLSHDPDEADVFRLRRP